MSTSEHSQGLIQCTQRQLSILEQSMTIWVKMSFQVSLGKKRKKKQNVWFMFCLSDVQRINRT